MLQQGAIAVCAGAAGVLLLLLLGTQILDWQWPLALFLAMLAFGAYRVRRARTPLYGTAQSLDRALGLQDRLSTVFYFRRLAGKAPNLVDVVEHQALARVQPGDIERAIPLRFPSAAYVACGAIVVVVSVLALRYGLLRTMSLEQPLARITFDTFRTAPKVEAASTRKSVVQEHLEQQLQQMGLTPEEIEKVMEKSAEAPNSIDVQAISDEPGGTQKGPPGQNPSDPSGDDAEEEKSDAQSSAMPSAESKDEGAGEQSPGQKGQASATPPKTPPKQGGTNPGVMDKMKDALANLLNKLGSNPQQKGQDTASNQSQQQGAARQQMAEKQGTQGQGKAQGDNQPSPDPEGGKDAEGGEQTPGQQQRASQQDGQKSGTENSKSGMGKSDGDKSIKDAEQLAAMGKISEIFGKRAAEMQGEMSVEVPSGKQQLRTAYSNSSATHAGAVADANRNEIPLAYQPYVQRYFEQVRKAAAAPKPPLAAR